MTLPIRVDRSQPITLQLQLYDQLRALISDGTLRSGRAMPATRNFASTLRVSRNTVVLAYEMLSAEGYIRTIRGRGTFVADWRPELFGPAGARKKGDPFDVDDFKSGSEVFFAVANEFDFRPGLGVESFPSELWRRSVANSLTKQRLELFSRAADSGSFELRSAITDHLARSRLINVSPSQVIITSGVQEALLLASQLVVRPGLAVAVEDPCKMRSARAIESLGGRLVPIPVDEGGMKGSQLNGSEAKVIYVTQSHQHPTGAVLAEPRRQELLAWASAHGANIIEDESGALPHLDSPMLPSLFASDRSQSTIYVGDISVFFCAIVQTGYLVVPPRLAREARERKSAMGGSSPIHEQTVLAELLPSPAFSRHVRLMGHRLSEARDALRDAVSAHLPQWGHAIAGTGTQLSWYLPRNTLPASVIASRAWARGIKLGEETTKGDVLFAKATAGPALQLGFGRMSPSQIEKGVRSLALAINRPTHAVVEKRPIRIGIINDQSGIYADHSGIGSVEAARMAAEEVGGFVMDRRIEIVSADHHNDPNIGAQVARRWLDEGGVDVIADLANSAVAVPVRNLVRQRGGIALVTSAATDLIEDEASPKFSQWIGNSYTNGYGLAKILTQTGKRKWFVITSDYVLGYAFERDIGQALEREGGQIIGNCLHKPGTKDFRELLQKAKRSGADVVAFANSGHDLINAVRQARELRLAEEMTLAAPMLMISDIHSLGLEAVSSLHFITAFYWDYDERSRVWARKFFARRRSMPTVTQAGVYSAIRNYLRAVAAAGSTEPAVVIEKMQHLDIDDAFTRNGRLRNDGQATHDMYYVRAKRPEQSKGAWDYCEVINRISAEASFKPMAERFFA